MPSWGENCLCRGPVEGTGKAYPAFAGRVPLYLYSGQGRLWVGRAGVWDNGYQYGGREGRLIFSEIITL